jgi:hypothetical protein
MIFLSKRENNNKKGKNSGMEGGRTIVEGE